MRFLPNGPSIPDDLLVARDRGDVIFFCGAGVSRAKAGLVDFGSLARAVIDDLGAARDSPARKLLEKAIELGTMAGVGGLLATDRVFGLLEREFEVEDVRRAVSRALKPAEGCDLSAHRTILDLATTAKGVTRLVTTNFDLLFELTNQNLRSSGPPHLPDPRNGKDFNSIVHLHGRVDVGYSEPQDEEFVVSSADFGRAYLADGWATRFIQSLLARFQIVFIGYTADDPPVQYLLEALNLQSGGRARLYAFQAGGGDEAAALWRHRGVEAIQFDTTNGYDSLWSTLEAWAERARDSDGWNNALLTQVKDPAALSPNIRGQIAHLISTKEGAHRIAISDPPLDGRWILTFDPAQRYARPQSVDRYAESSPSIDPFALLCIDDDVRVEPTSRENPFQRPLIPEGAWNPFLPTRRDSEEAADLGTAPLLGGLSVEAGALAPRLTSIGVWIQRVAHQPVILWWACQQGGLHPNIRKSIIAWLRQDPERFPISVRRGWDWLFSAWSDIRQSPDMVFYEVQTRVERDGWSEALVREYVASFRPRLKVDVSAGSRHPLTWATEEVPENLIHVDVDYPHPHTVLTLPADYLPYAVRLFRADLELARSLELEVTGHDQVYLETTRAPDGGPALGEDSYGLTGPVLRFQNLMGRLAAVDEMAARSEVCSWPTDDYIFARLRIWAVSASIFGGREAGELLLSLSDKAFWGATQARDLLYALRDRWVDLPDDIKQRLEERLLTSHFPWDSEPRRGFEKANAHYRLDYLHWLMTHGVVFSFDEAAEIGRLKLIASEWVEQSGNAVADSHAPVAIDIMTDDDPASILDKPIAEILEASKTQSNTDFFSGVQREPFRGLAKRRPVIALAVLTHAARRNMEAAAQWRDFLNLDSRHADSARLATAIAGRLLRLPDEQFYSVSYPVAEWMKSLGTRFYTDLASTLPWLWGRMVSVLTAFGDGGDAIPDGWAGRALNAPIGKLFDLWMLDPATKNISPGGGLPKSAADRLESLLQLPTSVRPQAIVMTAVQLTWLSVIDPEWTRRQLVPYADSQGEEGKAFWEGAFWAGRFPNRDLYPLLKPGLSRLALADHSLGRREAGALAAFLVAGWLGVKDKPEQFFTNVELRELLIRADDDLRGQMVHQMTRLIAGSEGHWRDRVIPFLREVWPKQRAVRSPRMSAALTDLALGAGDLMPSIVEVILAYLVPITGASARGFWQIDGVEHPIRRFPRSSLDLIWAILSDDPSEWPYRIEEVIRLLSETPETSGDPRLSELRRRRDR